jgi:transcriptional regulator with XRE-family HTH domain
MKKTIYSEEHKYLIEQLRKARKEANFEQNEVAKLLSKTQSYISKIESGQRRVDLVQLREFAKIYKKPLNYFISR